MRGAIDHANSNRCGSASMTRPCPNCAASVPDSARFCNKCGAKLVPTQPAQAGAPPQSYQVPPPIQSAPPNYPQPQYSTPASSSGLQPNIAGLLCYLVGLITGILFLVLEPYSKDRFVRFHAFQSIFLHVAWIALWIVASILSSILPWGLGFIASLLYLFLFLGGLAVWIFTMVKAYNNEKFKIPVIGDMAEQQAG